MSEQLQQDAIEHLHRLQDELRKYAPPEYSIPLEPILVQALVATVDTLPAQVRHEMRVLIDLVRVHKGGYGSYIDLKPGQIGEGEQVLQMEELGYVRDERAPYHSHRFVNQQTGEPL